MAEVGASQPRLSRRALLAASITLPLLALPVHLRAGTPAWGRGQRRSALDEALAGSPASGSSCGQEGVAKPPVVKGVAPRKVF